MQLMSVTETEISGNKELPGVINVDSIKRISPTPNGASICFIDGSIMFVADPYDDLIKELLKVKP